MSALEHGWLELVSGRSRAWWAGPARAGLALLSAPYAAGISGYRALFDFGILRPAQLPCPVVSIGNITVGGTGKTTTVRWLVRRLQAWGRRPAILSRGYRSAEGGARVTVVAGPEGLRQDARAGGDEPVVLARSLPGVPVLIGRKRVRSGLLACEEFQPDVLVLDDAFQYWRLRKDLEILLVDATNPFGYGSVFPRGLLREPLRGIRRAGAAILTHAGWATEEERAAVRAALQRRMPGGVIAEARHVPVRLRDLHTGAEEPLSRLAQGGWLAVSGLGRPGAFEATLGEAGAARLESLAFPDHHAYTASDLHAAAERVRASGLSGIVTTEKDAVKFDPAWLPGTRCLVLEIDLEFLRGEADLERLLQERVSRGGRDR